jgi:uncharacterized protein (TIGR00645 family)
MLENTIERLIFGSRWLLAPIYLGLSGVLLAVSVRFFMEIWHLFMTLFAMSKADMLVGTLSLIDQALIGSLVVTVMLSGYENFISQFDIEAGSQLEWMGKMDASKLKLKLAASIVAISSIELLGVFVRAESIPNDKILWYVLLHLTFVASAMMLALLDRLAFGKNHGK